MSDSISLTQAVEFAFAPDGPVARAYGEYRPAQAAAAVGVANFIEQQAFLNPGEIPLYIQEQQGGIGKTAVISVVAILDALINSRRAVISTFRRNLRRAYLEETPIFQQIVRETLIGLRRRTLYRDISVREYRSVASFISPMKVEELRQRWQDGRIATQDADKLRVFLDWFDQSEGARFPLEFSEWYDLPDSENGTLPCGYREQDLCFGPADHGLEAYQEREKERMDVLEHADILLVTHAMLMRNSVSRGSIMRTDEEDDRIFRQIGGLFIDEADKLPQVARSTLTFTITTGLIDGILRQVELLEVGRRAAREALAKGISLLQDALPNLKDEYLPVNAKQGNVVVLEFNEPQCQDILAHLRMVDDGLWLLRQIVLGRYDEDDNNPILADQIRMLLEQLRVILSARTYPLLSVDIINDTNGELEVSFSANLASGKRLVHQFWRPQANDPVPLHQIGAVVMVSAALTDRAPHNDRYLRFARELGIDDEVDAVHRAAPITPQGFGSIEHVFVVERDASLLPTDNEARFLLNEQWIQATARAINTAAQRMLQRPPSSHLLVLFHSYPAMLAVREAVDPSLEDRIMSLRRREWSAAMQDFALLDHGIWFGVEWEGANFVDPDSGRTLIDSLMVTRIPLPPRDAVRQTRLENAFAQRGIERPSLPAGLALQENLETAYRRTRQGILRAIRHASDVLRELYILDARFPVPDRIAAAGGGTRIMRSMGDPRGLFRSFSHILDPWDIENWSEIDKEGNVTPILPEEE